jgi:primosomal protein N' (replication factor Y)
VGDAVRRLIPAVAFERAEEIYFPLEKSDDETLNTRTAAIFKYIKAHAPVRAEKLTKEFEGDIRPMLRHLIRDGYVGVDTVIKEVRGASEEIAVLNPEADAIILSKPRTPEEQRRLFAEIAENGRIRVKLLLDAGYKPSHIKSLQKKGLIFLEKKEVIRNPYGALPSEKPKKLILNEEQNAAYERLSALLADEKPHAALLYGVTGSGKTGVILSLCEKALESGKTAIVLIPEIALTWQSVTAFTSRFGDRIAVMHSGLSDGERFDAYKRIRRGEIDIVLGTRSAIFAPIPRLGLIVIDEEQESAYKSDMSPKYHARDIAKFRAASANALLVMASATPSVESFYEAQCGKYELVKLN